MRLQWVDILAKRVRRRGRSRKTELHREWEEKFLEKRRELNGDDALGLESPTDTHEDCRLNNIELCKIVVDELGLTVFSRAVWDAIKNSEAAKTA